MQAIASGFDRRSTGHEQNSLSANTRQQRRYPKIACYMKGTQTGIRAEGTIMAKKSASSTENRLARETSP
jgi:hypothetical protein